MKIIKGIMLSIITIFLIGILCFILKSKSNNFNIFGYSTFINTGTSMYPTIDIGDLLIVKKEDNYYIDDIITFKSDENIITTHRIIDTDNNTYITKGDSNNFIDGYQVTKNDIYGKVISIISNYQVFLKSIIYFIILLLIIIINFVFIKKNNINKD